ncbi:Transposase [Paenibacillus catalpae]|uniref:Transposase n=1 Tax=Paenibacillus catalpae TaxID=1045775 RepID=A0A1I2I447_9BACL|nr:Transposase [Paenibacillus catalpae]
MMGLSRTHQGGALTMKFKEIDAQNQRVEQITTSHLVIGIDMAKEIDVTQATNFRGIVVSKRHLEPTGHYWFNLANWLADKSVHVVMVNPATTKRNKENRDNSPSKNDPKDALTIADSVSRGFYYEYTRLIPDQDEETFSILIDNKMIICIHIDRFTLELVGAVFP